MGRKPTFGIGAGPDLRLRYRPAELRRRRLAQLHALRLARMHAASFDRNATEQLERLADAYEGLIERVLEPV
jgi:hypothetical protein